jgi:hypothetical protein
VILRSQRCESRASNSAVMSKSICTLGVEGIHRHCAFAKLSLA